jgi:hypothetical protein
VRFAATQRKLTKRRGGPSIRNPKPQECFIESNTKDTRQRKNGYFYYCHCLTPSSTRPSHTRNCRCKLIIKGNSFAPGSVTSFLCNGHISGRRPRDIASFRHLLVDRTSCRCASPNRACMRTIGGSARSTTCVPDLFALYYDSTVHFSEADAGTASVMASRDIDKANAISFAMRRICLPNIVGKGPRLGITN